MQRRRQHLTAAAAAAAAAAAPAVDVTHCPLTVSRRLLPAAVHNNLVSNIDAGAGTRIFNSGGNAGRGAHSGGCQTACSPCNRTPATGTLPFSTGPPALLPPPACSVLHHLLERGTHWQGCHQASCHAAETGRLRVRAPLDLRWVGERRGNVRSEAVVCGGGWQRQGGASARHTCGAGGGAPRRRHALSGDPSRCTQGRWAPPHTHAHTHTHTHLMCLLAVHTLHPSEGPAPAPLLTFTMPFVPACFQSPLTSPLPLVPPL